MIIVETSKKYILYKCTKHPFTFQPATIKIFLSFLFF